MTEYRKSKVGAYPLDYGWGYSVVAPDGTRVTQAGFATEKDAKAAATEKDAKAAARRQGRFYDRLERDRVDGIAEVRTDRVLERGVRVCERCGKPHDLVALTRRGRRSGQTWAAPDGHSYYSESWESVARRLLTEREAA